VHVKIASRIVSYHFANPSHRSLPFLLEDLFPGFPGLFTDTPEHNNNNNNNSHDNVYGAVIMTTVIARVHPVHLMNVD